jgi:hypothetical protein
MKINVVSVTHAKLLTLRQEPLNLKFLRALEKTREIWDNDKQFSRIVQKMQKGKNLKREEFDKVHLYLRENCQYY